MAGGANDFVLPALSLQDWSAAYLNFLQTVSAFTWQTTNDSPLQSYPIVLGHLCSSA